MEVVGLGAWCDIVTEDEFREQLASVGLTGQVFQEALSEFKRTASFRVSEFAVPGDGRRLTLHDEHGFSTSSSRGIRGAT